MTIRPAIAAYYARVESRIARYQNEDATNYAGSRDEEGFSFSTTSIIVFQECAAAQSIVTREALFNLIHELSVCGRL